MKKPIWILIVILGLILLMAVIFYSERINRQVDSPTHKSATDKTQIQDGDLIFQTSRSGQSKAIQLATKSTYSHCGIIYKIGNAFYVYEAVQPVKTTPLNAWIARGSGGKYIVKRLKKAAIILTTDVLKKMKVEGEKLKGKNYDMLFGWSDESIYCSELIWKIYKRGAGIEVGKLEKLSDFDLTSDIVKNTMKNRYGNNIPLNETVVSPKAVFESDLLETIIEK